MNGIQYYLNEDVPIAKGHPIYVDSPWALTSVSQPQFWTDVDLSRYGDGNIRGVLSVDISDWDTPGLNGKAARECTRREISVEVWEQLKSSLNVGRQRARGRDQLHWYLDLDIDPLLRANAEPLLVNLVDTWRIRPRAVTPSRICSWPPTTSRRSPIWPPWRLPTRPPGARSTASSSTRGRTRAVRALGSARAGAAGALARERSSALPAGAALGRHRGQARAVGAGGALQRGQRARGIDVNVVSSAMHVEDLLSYIRTGESRSELVQRLTSGPGAPLVSCCAPSPRWPAPPPARRSRWRPRRWRRSRPRSAIHRMRDHPA